MKRLIDWFRSWFAAAHYSRRMSAVERRLDGLDRERQRTEQTIERRATALAASEARMKAALETAQSTIRQYDETTQELRAELQVQTLEVQLMEAAHRKQLERYDAETKIEVRRGIGNQPYQGDQVVE